ncbi:MAG: gas vesicle protein [Hamadaea sp.]|uniref:gas vesicle protein GvpO n=1 Tax=Hamadaea sp. NPDC050747 TaxID=3155789 RepID=UPI00179A55A1|nr:gas vesicle protein [Hamadaea sp.]NUR47464.1 gas vesicle protein [Hamadaea sp.]NUT04870.1 gas vesicle protein [Hamadaea sp.]
MRTHHDTDVSGRRRNGADQDLTTAEAAQAGLRHVADLTGNETVGIVSVEPSDQGWLIGVETVEERRVPSSTDVLALYTAEIDLDGELLSYRRVRRYSRGHGDDGVSS